MGTPDIVERLEEPCLAIPLRATMASLGRVAPAALAEVQAWAGGRNLAPGIGFFRYRTIDMARDLPSRSV
jgi:hypothetical protein